MRRTIFTVAAVLLIAITADVYGQAMEWYVNKPIKDIQFIGLNNIDEAELEGVAAPFIGKPFSDTLFWDLQSKLYALNYFESFTANAIPADSGQTEVVIEFTVKERPLVGRILIKGNASITRSKILESILIKEDDILNNARIRLDIDSVKKLYLEEGYPDAVVESRTEESTAEGYVDVVFSIEEGSQTRIKKIAFSGNSFASENTLKQQLDMKEQSFFSKGVFKESLMEKDKTAVVKYYHDNGYIDARVIDVVVDEIEDEEAEDGRKYVGITYFIEEGGQWTFSGMEFDGNTLYSDEQLLSKVSHKIGGVINRSRLESDFMAVGDLYYNDGYIYNSINREEQRNPETREIGYKVVIQEMGRAHIENIIIDGNEKTKDYVILREIPLSVGDVFSKSKIMEGLNNLYNTRYFSSVVPQMPYGSKPGLMDLIINVEEQNTMDIQFGLTFTATAGTIPVIGFLKWNDSNFLGEGKDLSVGVNLSPSKQELTLGWQDNWLFDKRLSAGFDFSFKHNQYNSVPQDIMYPVFTQDQNDNPQVVPDPYDGHWVDASTGEAVDYEPTQEQIDQKKVMTDYDYAMSKGKTIGSEYLMKYDSYSFSLSGNAGYTFHTPVGRVSLGAGISTALSYAIYDPTIYRPFDKNIRDSLKTWLLTNKLWTTAAWDTRDLVYSPNSGFLLKETLTYTGGLLFGSKQYIKSTTDADIYLKLFDIPVTEEWNLKTVMGFHTQFSMILPQFYYAGEDGWGWNTVASREDLLYFDGMFLARGWGYNYDNKILWDNVLDFTTPLSPGLLSWTTFLSTTAVWSSYENLANMSLDDFYFSLGTGLQIDMPSFPISFFLVKRGKFTDGVFSLEKGSYLGSDTDPASGIDFVITFDIDYF